MLLLMEKEIEDQENSNKTNCSSIKKLVDSLIKGQKYILKIEKELKIKDKNWEQLLDDDKTKIWRKNVKDNIYLYLTYNKFECNSNKFFNFISNLNHRKKWESSTVDIKILNKNDNSCIYDWEVKRVWPYSNINYLCEQKYYSNNTNHSIITNSLDINNFNVNKDIPRCDKYFSHTYITGLNKCQSYCLFYDDQKINIPNIIYSRAVSLFIPQILKDLNTTISKELR